MLQKLKRNYYNVPLYIYLAFLLCSLLFVAFPEIDIFISSLFFDGDFYLKGSLFEHFFYNSVPVVVSALGVATLGIFLYNKLFGKKLLRVDAKRVLYIILVLALAPGLIVNATLKDNWEEHGLHRFKSLEERNILLLRLYSQTKMVAHLVAGMVQLRLVCLGLHYWFINAEDFGLLWHLDMVWLSVLPVSLAEVTF